MRKKVEKYEYIRIADIYIKAACNADHIACLIDILKYENILVTITSAEKQSFPFRKLEHNEAKYKITKEYMITHENISYVDVVLIASPNCLKKLLNDIFECNIEMITLLNINEACLWEECFEYIKEKKCTGRDMIKAKLSDVFFTAGIYECGIGITLNKTVYNVRQIAAQVKELF